MADWLPAPDNNPALVPDGTRVRLTAEGVRGTHQDMPLWAGSRAHVTLDISSCDWHYYDPAAAERRTEFVAGFEAGAALGRALLARERLVGAAWVQWVIVLFLTLWTVQAVAYGIEWWPTAVLALFCAALGTHTLVRLHRLDREARRG